MTVKIEISIKLRGLLLITELHKFAKNQLMKMNGTRVVPVLLKTRFPRIIEKMAIIERAISAKYTSPYTLIEIPEPNRLTKKRFRSRLVRIFCSFCETLVQH